MTSIGDDAFNGCSELTSMVIGNKVKSIGPNAFKGCSGLTSVTIPDSVTSIGESAFERCSGLTSVTIPDSVTSIGANIFYNCSNIEYIEFKNRTSAQVASIRPLAEIHNEPTQIITTDTRALNTTGEWHTYDVVGRLDAAALNNTQGVIVKLAVGSNVTIIGNEAADSNLFNYATNL